MTATDTAPAPNPGAGLTGSATHGPSSNSLVLEVARKFGVNPFKQFFEMLRLSRSRNKIVPAEYFWFQLYRPDLTMAEKREYVGEKTSFELNLRLAPPTFTNMRNFLADKAGFTTMVAGFGLPTTHLQAAFSPNRGFGTLPTLRTAEEIRAFLTGPARYPLFGKPIRGLQAQGSVMIEAVQGDAAILATGARVPLDRLCAEIATNTAFGYVFQDAVTPHPEIAALSGSKAVSTARVVTVNETGVPSVLYTVWKIPSATAMSDNFWQAGSLLSMIDRDTGEVLNMRQGGGVETRWLETHPVTGAQIKGITLPNWQKVIDLALAAHALVPDNGILGWDIAITPEGACVIECNENTGHEFYQLAADRGVMNADFLPIFDRVEARNKAMMQDFSAKQKAYLRSKARA